MTYRGRNAARRTRKESARRKAFDDAVAAVVNARPAPRPRPVLGLEYVDRVESIARSDRVDAVEHVFLGQMCDVNPPRSFVLAACPSVRWTWREMGLRVGATMVRWYVPEPMGLEDGRAATSSARKATAMALRAIQSVVPYRHWGDIEHAAEFMKVAVDAIEEWLGVP